MDRNLPDFSMLVVAHLDGWKWNDLAGATFGRSGYAFMVRHNGDETAADGWSRRHYDDALARLDMDGANVDRWAYLETVAAIMTPVEPAT